MWRCIKSHQNLFKFCSVEIEKHRSDPFRNRQLNSPMWSNQRCPLESREGSLFFFLTSVLKILHATMPAARYGCEWLITFGRTVSQNRFQMHFDHCLRRLQPPHVRISFLIRAAAGRLLNSDWSRSTLVAFVSVIDLQFSDRRRPPPAKPRRSWTPFGHTH